MAEVDPDDVLLLCSKSAARKFTLSGCTQTAAVVAATTAPRRPNNMCTVQMYTTAPAGARGTRALNLPVSGICAASPTMTQLDPAFYSVECALNTPLRLIRN